MAHQILEGYPGYRLELPDDENPQTTVWFATHLLELAMRRLPHAAHWPGCGTRWGLKCDCNYPMLREGHER